MALIVARWNPEATLERYLIWAAAGLMVWSIVEYGLHRLAFHGDSDHQQLLQFRRAVHLHHHGRPRNKGRILIRPLFSLSISLFFFLLIFALSQSLLICAALLTGLWTGFLYYEAVHYRIHLSKKEGPLLSRQRRWHFYHHYVDDRYCYGVTSPLWDHVFGTYREAHRHHR